MDSTVGREEEVLVEIGGLWGLLKEEFFSWVVEVGSLELGLGLLFFSGWFGGVGRLDVDVDVFDFWGGVLEQELELELDGSDAESESLSEALLWVMWIVICSCMPAERAAVLMAWSSV